MCGDVGRVVPNIPQPLCLGGAGLMPVRRWGPEEGCSAWGRIWPSVHSLTWSQPLATASPWVPLEGS